MLPIHEGISYTEHHSFISILSCNNIWIYKQLVWYQIIWFVPHTLLISTLEYLGISADSIIFNTHRWWNTMNNIFYHDLSLGSKCRQRSTLVTTYVVMKHVSTMMIMQTLTIDIFCIWISHIFFWLNKLDLDFLILDIVSDKKSSYAKVSNTLDRTIVS